MLILERKQGESIDIGSDVRVIVLGIEKGRIKLGIEAPRSVAIYRSEIVDMVSNANRTVQPTAGAIPEALKPRPVQGHRARPTVTTPRFRAIEDEPPAPRRTAEQGVTDLTEPDEPSGTR